MLQEKRTEFSPLGLCQSASCRGFSHAEDRALKGENSGLHEMFPCCTSLEKVRSAFRVTFFQWMFSFLAQTRHASVQLEVFMCRMSSLPLPIFWVFFAYQEDRRELDLHVTQREKRVRDPVNKIEQEIFTKMLTFTRKQFDFCINKCLTFILPFIHRYPKLSPAPSHGA